MILNRQGAKNAKKKRIEKARPDFSSVPWRSWRLGG
jgi:hypothetical protein